VFFRGRDDDECKVDSMKLRRAYHPVELSLEAGKPLAFAPLPGESTQKIRSRARIGRRKV
jgi:hypothetical protein